MYSGNNKQTMGICADNDLYVDKGNKLAFINII